MSIKLNDQSKGLYQFSTVLFCFFLPSLCLWRLASLVSLSWTLLHSKRYQQLDPGQRRNSSKCWFTLLSPSRAFSSDWIPQFQTRAPVACCTLLQLWVLPSSIFRLTLFSSLLPQTQSCIAILHWCFNSTHCKSFLSQALFH